jgi:hypothetical protein
VPPPLHHGNVTTRNGGHGGAMDTTERSQLEPPPCHQGSWTTRPAGHGGGGGGGGMTQSIGPGGYHQ